MVRTFIFLIVTFGFAGAFLFFGPQTSAGFVRRLLPLSKNARTVAQVVAQLEVPVREKFAPTLVRLGLDWPLRDIVLIAFKKERKLELWSKGKLIREYPVTAASGKRGPKLREGDEQVPEGIYRISGLNPNSAFHLSLRVNYPSDEDKRLAQAEKRTGLGRDIFVHGSAVSIGCIAVGDTAIEEIFVVAAKAKSLPTILIAPRDFRKEPPNRADLTDLPEWMKPRYDALSSELRRYLTN